MHFRRCLNGLMSDKRDLGTMRPGEEASVEDALTNSFSHPLWRLPPGLSRVIYPWREREKEREKENEIGSVRGTLNLTTMWEAAFALLHE